METHHIILIVCLTIIALSAVNVIYVVKKAYKAGKEFNDNNFPTEIKPVLAKIEHITWGVTSLYKSTWYEVVYYDEQWRCYTGSDTFKNGENVVNWRYCKDLC